MPLMKSQFTGRTHVNYTNAVPWTRKSTLKICSCKKMSQELKVVKKFASWNDFPNYIANSIFRKTIQTHEDKSEPNRTAKQKELVIYFCFPYY